MMTAAAEKRRESQQAQPHILDAIRMFRELREWSFERARDHAIEEYRRKGWEIPKSIEGLYKKAGK